MVRDQPSLNAELVAILGGTDAENRVYYQPTEESRLTYPCIVYSKDPAYRLRADNTVFHRKQRYELELIDRKPNNPAFDVLDNRPYCSHVRSFVADGLHHDVFDLYY